MFFPVYLAVVAGLALSGCAAVFLFTPYRFSSRRAIRLINKIPGPKTIPFFGSLFEFNLKHEEIVPKATELLQKHGSVYKVWMLGVPHVFLNDPNDIEIVLNNKIHMDKSELYRFLHPWLGTGLLTSTEAAMGTTVNAQRGGHMEYISAVMRMGELFQHRYMSFWIYQDIVFSLTPTAREQKKVLNILHSFSQKVISQRRAEYRLQADKPPDPTQDKRKRLTFLDLLIDVSEREGSLTDADIQEEVDTFMFEGHDTTAYAISRTIFLLGHHPEIQDRACAELVEIFGNDPRPATAADLTSMRYLEQVIKEALRLYPSVPGLSRTLTQNAEIRDYTIPPGVTVVILPYLVHRNPELYPDPEKFDPERFSPDNSTKRHPFSYIPFSAGPRNCIGQKFALMEEKTVLSYLLRNFKFRSLQKREDMKVLAEMILKPRDGIRVQVVPRNFNSLS